MDAAAGRGPGLALDAIEAPALLVDPDARVLAFNGVAAALVAPAALDHQVRTVGDTLGCVHAAPAGCGRSERCTACPLRQAVGRAVGGARVDGRVAEVALARDGVTRMLVLRVAAEPLIRDGVHLALMVLRPATAVA